MSFLINAVPIFNGFYFLSMLLSFTGCPGNSPVHDSFVAMLPISLFLYGWVEVNNNKIFSAPNPEEIPNPGLFRSKEEKMNVGFAGSALVIALVLSYCSTHENLVKRVKDYLNRFLFWM